MLSTLGARSSLSIFKKKLKDTFLNIGYKEYVFLGVVNCVFLVLGFIDISYNSSIYIFKSM